VNEAPRLAAPGVVLRPLLLSDAAALFVALSDADVQRYRRAAAHVSVEETHAYLADTLARSRAAWAITEDGGEALGRLALREPEPGVGEFGIVIRRAAHGRGLGRKAIALASAYAFEALQLERLRADIDAQNEASLHLFRGAGFDREAFRPAFRVTKLGVRDSVVLERLRPANLAQPRRASVSRETP
jgi:ribosomal-protein-alanine N-acetyltransferase